MAVVELKPFEFIVMQSDAPVLNLYRAGSWDIALVSRMSPLRSKGNEDCVALIDLGEKGVVLVVADGAGGYPQADIASRTVCEAISEYLVTQGQASGSNESGIREWVLGAVDLASVRIKEKAPLGRTTLTLGAIEQDQIKSYQVGDSELLVCGQRGRIKHRTRSHSPVGYALAAGDLNEKQALLHPDRHLVSNFIGEGDCRVEVSIPSKLQPRDTVLAGTDGLFDNFLVNELIEVVRTGDIAVSAETLNLMLDRKFSRETGGVLKFDDVSFVLARKSFRG